MSKRIYFVSNKIYFYSIIVMAHILFFYRTEAIPTNLEAMILLTIWLLLVSDCIKYKVVEDKS